MQELVGSYLSKDQIEALLGGESRIVTACPGAGKTRSIAARAAVFASSGDRLALTSYTNVGAEEIASSIEDIFNYHLTDDHFVGTLHGLFLRYTFRNFGHLVMGCGQAPSVRKARSKDTFEVNGWQLNPDHFMFTADGGLEYRGPVVEKYVSRLDVASVAGGAARERKLLEASSEGTCNANDAMYWCLLALQSSTDAAEALAYRFTEIIVDEAQDTSALQLACLATLMESEHAPRLVMVGDFDQSIYAFQGASPDGCKALALQAGLLAVRLKENYRSSQLICDVAARLRRTTSPDVAVGANADVGIAPQLITYDAENPSSIVPRFEGMLEQSGIPTDNAVILTRANALARQIGGGKTGDEIGSASRTLLDAMGRRRVSLDLRLIRDVEDLVIEAAGLDADEDALVSLDRSLLRATAIELIEGLPDDVTSYGDWHTQAALLLESSVLRLVGGSAHAIDVLGELQDQRVFLPLSDLLPAQGVPRVQAGTIHSVKGKSVDGVLLVASPSQSYRGWEGDLWGEHFRQGITSGSVETSEDVRVLYVGVTRAAKLLAIALPDFTASRTIQLFQDAGFDGP